MALQSIQLFLILSWCSVTKLIKDNIMSSMNKKKEAEPKAIETTE